MGWDARRTELAGLRIGELKKEARVVGVKLKVVHLYGYSSAFPQKLWRCPPLAGAPGAARSGQELTVPPGRSRHAVLKKITERSRP